MGPTERPFLLYQIQSGFGVHLCSTSTAVDKRWNGSERNELQQQHRQNSSSRSSNDDARR